MPNTSTSTRSTTKRGHGAHGRPGRPGGDESASPKWPGGGKKGEDEKTRAQSKKKASSRG